MKRLFMMAAILIAYPEFQAKADYTWTIPGPTSVTDSTNTLQLNDVGNSEGVPNGVYQAFEVTADWTDAGGNPWSSDSRIDLSWVGAQGGGSTGEIPATLGAQDNGDPAALTWAGNFADFGTDYEVNGVADASVQLALRQDFGGSSANWANIVVTFFDTPPPLVLPTTLATFDLTSQNGYNYNAAHASTEVDWFEIIHPGGVIEIMNSIGSDFDTQIGLYDSDGNLAGTDDDSGGNLTSSLDGGDTGTVPVGSLAAGTYYLAASGFNTTFGETFFGVTGGNAEGQLNVDVALNAIPEPSSGLVIAGLCGLAFFYRRRRKTA